MRAVASLFPVKDNKLQLWTDVETSDWDDMVAACKAVPGARFSRKLKVWLYPLSVETCHALRQVWGDALAVSRPTVGDQAGTEYARTTVLKSFTPGGK